MRISKTLTALAGITSAASFLPTASALRKETRSKTKPDLKVFPKEIGAGSEILVPYLSRRSLSKRDPAPEQWPISTGDVVVEDLELPMVGETVDIVFGSESSQASENPFLTTVELVPPPNRAILVLEGYLLQSVLKEVRCEEEEEGSSLNQVILTMTQAGSVSDAFNQWLVAIVENKQQDLVVITSDIMQGCGVKERKPFLVNTMSTNGLMTTLDVKPLEWSSVAKKLSFDFGHSSKNPNLSKRNNMDKFVKVDGDDDPEDGYHGNGTLELKDDIGSRIKLFPLPAEIAAIIQPGNLPETAFQSLFGADEEEQGGEKEIPPLEVHCVGCGLSGILRYQGRFDVDSNFPNLFGTDDDDNEGGEDDGEDSDLVHLDHAWMSIEVVKDMVASMFLEVATGPKPFSFVFQQSIFPAIGNTQGLPITGFGVPGILAVTVYFDFSVKFAIEVNAPSTNVTMGGELRIPAGATVLWDLVDETEDTVKNWDTTAKLVPTTVNNITIEKDKDLSVAVNISSIPSLTFDVNALTFVSAGLRISLEMPELYTTTSLVTDVTEFCAPIGKDDYIYYPYAILFESGLATAIEAEVYAEVGLEFGGGEGTNHPDQKNPQDPLVIGAGVSEIWELWNHNLVTFPPACFVFGNIETWQGQFRNASSPEVKDQEMVVDVEKIESEFKSSGKLPDANGIDWKKLLEEKGDVLPKELKEKVVEKVEGNEKKKEDTAFVGQDDINEAIAKLEDGRTLSAWTLAVIAIGAGMFPELNLN